MINILPDKCTQCCLLCLQILYKGRKGSDIWGTGGGGGGGGGGSDIWGTGGGGGAVTYVVLGIKLEQAIFLPNKHIIRYFTMISKYNTNRYLCQASVSSLSQEPTDTHHGIKLSGKIHPISLIFISFLYHPPQGVKLKHWDMTN